jgi:hypothetical protein
MRERPNNPLAADPQGRGRKMVAKPGSSVAAPLWSAEAAR